MFHCSFTCSSQVHPNDGFGLVMCVCSPLPVLVYMSNLMYSNFCTCTVCACVCKQYNHSMKNVQRALNNSSVLHCCICVPLAHAEMFPQYRKYLHVHMCACVCMCVHVCTCVCRLDSSLNGSLHHHLQLILVLNFPRYVDRTGAVCP